MNPSASHKANRVLVTRLGLNNCDVAGTLYSRWLDLYCPAELNTSLGFDLHVRMSSRNHLQLSGSAWVDFCVRDRGRLCQIFQRLPRWWKRESCFSRHCANFDLELQFPNWNAAGADGNRDGRDSIATSEPIPHGRGWMLNVPRRCSWRKNGTKFKKQEIKLRISHPKISKTVVHIFAILFIYKGQRQTGTVQPWNWSSI